MQVPEKELISKNKKLQYTDLLSKQYPEFFVFLYDKYIKNGIKQSQALYLFYNDLEEPPRCKYCGNPVEYKSFSSGYRDFCSRSCLSKANSVKILEKYGTKCTLTLSNVKNKSKETLLKHYGVEHNWASSEIIEKCKNTCIEKYGEDYYKKQQEKIQSSKKKKYGNAFFNNPEKYKKTCLKKYGFEHVSYSFSNDYKKEIQNKRLKTITENNTFNTSRIEKEFAEYLDAKNIKYKRQYKSEEYPYCCDFYLEPYNLYIEIQGSWTHGFHPYNPENTEDLKTVELWKSKNTGFYKNAVNTWTKRDVQKREIAKNNRLNYIEIFSNDIKTAVFIFENAVKKLENP